MALRSSRARLHTLVAWVPCDQTEVFDYHAGAVSLFSQSCSWRVQRCTFCTKSPPRTACTRQEGACCIPPRLTRAQSFSLYHVCCWSLVRITGRGCEEWRGSHVLRNLKRILWNNPDGRPASASRRIGPRRWTVVRGCHSVSGWRRSWVPGFSEQAISTLCE